jgi:hypothetical protein
MQIIKPFQGLQMNSQMLQPAQIMMAIANEQFPPFYQAGLS